MIRRLFLLLAALLWATQAHAQIVLPGGGSGSGGGSVNFATTCPTSTQSGSTITLTNNINVITKTGSYTAVNSTDCGSAFTFTLSGAATFTLPAPAAKFSAAAVTNAPTSTNNLVIAPVSGLINNASSISIAPGATIPGIYTDGTNYYPYGGANPAPMGPGYLVGPLYVPWYSTTQTTGTVAQSATVTYCYPNWIANINPPSASNPAGTGSGTIGTISINITTLSAGGNTQVALYNNNPATGQPGTLVASTASMSTAATGAVSSALNASVSQGEYWWCQQSDNTTVRYTVYSASLARAFMNGVTSVASITGNTYAGLSTPSTFGTWPNLSAATFTQTAAIAAAVFFPFSSIP